MKNFNRHLHVLSWTAVLAASCEQHFSRGCSTARANVATICQSLTEYAINNAGKYPSSLVPLVTPDTNGKCYLEGFNRQIPKDPWKHEYQYEPPTPEHPKPHVWSWGSDGKRGGTGDAADIDSDRLSDPER